MGKRWADTLNPFLGFKMPGLVRRALPALTTGRRSIVLWVVMGMAAGLGLLAFQVSNARSYMSESPEACINCHVMNSYYAGWAYSSHRGTASCNDCHVPHENVARKIAFKMSDGARHSFVFTFHLEPQTIRLTEAATSVVQTNCFRCHEHQIMATSMSTALTSPDSETTCFSCHRETPHGLAQSLSSSPDVRLPRVPSAGMPPPDARPAGVPDGPHGK